MSMAWNKDGSKLYLTCLGSGNGAAGGPSVGGEVDVISVIIDGPVVGAGLAQRLKIQVNPRP